MRDRDVHGRPERRATVSRRTAFVRNNGLARQGQPSFTIISNHCAHLGCPVQPNGPLDERARKQYRDVTLIPTQLDRRLRLPVPRRPVRHRGQPHRRPAGARARPLLVLDPERPPLPRQAVLGLARRRHRRARRRSTSGRSRSRASTSTGSSPGSTRSSRPTDGDARRSHAPSRSSRRSCTRSTGSRSARGSSAAIRYFLFRNVPGDINWFQTLGSATLTAFIVQALTGVILAMYYKPDPDDGLPVDPAHHERPLGRLARPRHAPLGRLGLHHPDVPAHGARLPVRRLQVPARAELDHRRAAARARARRGLHRLPAAVGPDVVLGDRRSGSTSTARRRSSGRSSRSSCRAARTSTPTRSARFYAIHMLLLPGAIVAPDRAAPVPRDPARRHLAAVVEGSRRHRPDRRRHAARAASRARPDATRAAGHADG